MNGRGIDLWARREKFDAHGIRNYNPSFVTRSRSSKLYGERIAGHRKNPQILEIKSIEDHIGARFEALIH